MRPPISFSLFLLVFASLPNGATAQDAAANPNYRYWSTNWSFTDIDLRDLGAKLRSIGLELPVKMSGRASINFDVSVPINAIRTGKAYRFRGTLSSTKVTVENARLDALSATVTYNDGVLVLSDLRATQREGKINGSAKAELIPARSFDASIEFSSFDMAPIAEIFTKFGIGSESRSVVGRSQRQDHRCRNSSMTSSVPSVGVHRASWKSTI